MRSLLIHHISSWLSSSVFPDVLVRVVFIRWIRWTRWVGASGTTSENLLESHLFNHRRHVTALYVVRALRNGVKLKFQVHKVTKYQCTVESLKALSRRTPTYQISTQRRQDWWRQSEDIELLFFFPSCVME